MGPDARAPQRRREGAIPLPQRRADRGSALERLTASRTLASAAFVGLAALSAALPLAVPFALAAGSALAWKRRSWLKTYPLRAPHDLPETVPTGVLGDDGIAFLGHERDTGREVWLGNSDMRQHLLVLGTTGAGKTESLLGIAANVLSWGGGFTYVDGKGDVSLFAKVYELCERFDRVHDLLVLNFMTGGRDMGPWALSNSMNPFRTGRADFLTQMVVSLMDDVGGDGAMWKGRATAMLTGVVRALCWLRDNEGQTLDVASLRDHMSLKRIVGLSCDERLPPQIRRSILSYLSSLPGYREDRADKQAQTTLDQHGYLEMQFTKILGTMADVYGHIFRGDGSDIDMRDVVLNRRILVVMLPALEKSGDEIANLGKIVMASLKGMMGTTLGSKLDGSWDDVVDNRPTRAESPYVAICDDAGYYMVDGVALMAAQSRSLGFSMVFASQDIPSLKRLNEKEGASIVANTNTKIFMRSSGDEPDAQRFAAEISGRLGFVDLKEQSAGEAVVASGGDAVRLRGFYAWEGQTAAQRKRRSGFRLRRTAPVGLVWDEEDPGNGDGLEGDLA